MFRVTNMKIYSYNNLSWSNNNSSFDFFKIRSLEKPFLLNRAYVIFGFLSVIDFLSSKALLFSFFNTL